MTAPIVKTLQWNAAFGPSGNMSERAAHAIEDLCSCLEELARSADTAELLLKLEHPGEAASLRQRVQRARSLLTAIRCTTCNGFGSFEMLGGGRRSCTDCAPQIGNDPTHD